MTHKIFRFAALAATLSLAALGRRASADVVPLTDRQLAAGSPHIVVATVEEATARWNEQHTLIFTDYRLRVEDRLRGDAPQRITLSMAGGTLDGQTHSTSFTTPLAPGARYLLFLQDLDRPLLTPVTGARQGVIREGRGKARDFARQVGSTRRLLARIAADPQDSDTAWKRQAESAFPLPAKRWDPTPRPMPAGALPPLRDEAGAAGEVAKALPYFVQNPPVAPLVFDPLPADAPFQGADQEMMAYWNLYSRSPIFLVARDPSPGWANLNGVSEVAGFPSDEEMEEYFGGGWPDGAVSTVFTTYEEGGPIVEADLALNPARTWTLGDTEPEVLPGEDVFSFKPAILRMLATAWGYHGAYDPANGPDDPAAWIADNVAGYTGKPMELRHATLMAADAAAVRGTFGGKKVRDGLISPYSSYLDKAGWPTWSYALPRVQSVRAGGSFAFDEFIKVENPGTARIPRPTVEVYLAPQRGSLRRAILLKRISMSAALRPGEIRRLALGSVQVPRSTPAGTYHIVYVLAGRDAYLPNNQAWAPHFAEVTVRR